MSSKRLLTIFGATGNQGGSIIDIVLARPELSSKYALRGISRDPSSGKSQTLSSKGVEIVQAELNDPESLKAAVKGSYGVFGVTDFWSIRENAKATEIQQGRNIVDAVKAAGVKHLVFSSLPNVSKLSSGKYNSVEHFDGKAEIGAYAEESKGDDLIVSYYMPAMFIEFVKQLVRDYNGTPTISLPWTDLDKPWPLVSPRRDGGKYVISLFEAGEKANGVAVQGVSTWTTANEVVKQASEFLGKDIYFNKVSAEVYGSFLPEAIRADLTEMMQWIAEASYYGEGSEKKQVESNEYLVKDADLLDFPTFLKEGGKWEV